MQIAVTGGAGKVGRAAIAELTSAGHRVVVLDVAPAPESLAVRCDVSDFGQVMGALSGIDTRRTSFDAVLHLAAIPAPGRVLDEVIFRNNTMSTYNIFSAAIRLGIKRVVWASSETVLGLPFRTPPDYAPLDEDHPDRPEWSYSLSKYLGEAMAKQFVRWQDGLSIVSLRFSNVLEASEYERLVPAVTQNLKPRAMNLWGYVDARDTGQACRLALESNITGHEAFIIAAADTIASVPSAQLMASHYPNVKITRPLEGRQSLLSSDKAARLLGYKPRHSWTDHVGRTA